MVRVPSFALAADLPPQLVSFMVGEPWARRLKRFKARAMVTLGALSSLPTCVLADAHLGGPMTVQHGAAAPCTLGSWQMVNGVATCTATGATSAPLPPTNNPTSEPPINGYPKPQPTGCDDDYSFVKTSTTSGTSTVHLSFDGKSPPGGGAYWLPGMYEMGYQVDWKWNGSTWTLVSVHDILSVPMSQAFPRTMCR